MTRKLKALGFVLSAILALVALAAASGWAGEEEGEQKGIPKRFWAEKAPALVTGNEATIENGFTNSKVETKCKQTHFIAKMAVTEVKELTVTPTYKECKTLNLDTHFELNGCDYTFTLKAGRTANTDQGTHTSGPVHIKCPDKSSMVFKVTTALGATYCTITIPPQTPTVPEVDTKNIGIGSTRYVLFTFTVTGVHYEVTGDNACGETGKKLTDGVIDTVISVAAYEDKAGGKQVGFKIYGDDPP
jgi:hypothetical protein